MMEPINNFFGSIRDFWTTDAKKAKNAPARGDTPAQTQRKKDTLQLIEDIETMDSIISRLSAWKFTF